MDGIYEDSYRLDLVEAFPRLRESFIVFSSNIGINAQRAQG